ncbi:MAG: hypothetical protein K1X81_14435 [Bacteroidia bacterium]|nr:hypothetical protein [Bacteroidia bacterium]
MPSAPGKFFRNFIFLVIGGYAGLIVSGTLTLYYFQSNNVFSLTLTESVFTSISALTGNSLLPVDPSGLIFPSQVVLLGLIQSGAWLFIVAVVYLFLLNKGKQFSIQSVIRQVVFISLLIEIAGACCIYVLCSTDIVFESSAQKWFHSFFLAVSAFCHSGISISGKYDAVVSGQVMVQLSMIPVLFAGSIGVLALIDMFSVSRLRKRLNAPDEDWELNTRVALSVTMFLTGIAAATYYFLESEPEGARLVEKVIRALFFALSADAGMFHIQSSAALHPITWVLLFVLMLTGTSTSSSGGGLKTSGVYALVSSFRNLSVTAIYGDLWNKTRWVIGYLIIWVLAGAFLLLSFHVSHDFLPSLFNSLSAFTTSGFYEGLLLNPCSVGGVTLSLLMLAGKPGILLLGHYLVKKYPEHRAELLPL